MRSQWISALAALALTLAVPRNSTAFDPTSQALVLVNLSVPARAETRARLELLSATLFTSAAQYPAEIESRVLDSYDLAGRAPRWARFEVSPGQVDSLELTWSGIEVQLDEAWIRVPVQGPTTIPVHQWIDEGGALVLNLRWSPDEQPVAAADWSPSFELEEIPEPPLGGRVYVSEEDEGVVSVFERVNGRMVRALVLGGNPRDLKWDPLRQRLYVVLGGRDELAILDVAGLETIRRAPLSFGADPTRVLLTEDRQRLAVLAPGRDMVFLYSAASLQETAKVRVGQGPVAMAEDPRTGLIYVSCRTAGEIDVIDPVRGRVVNTFAGFESPTELASLQSGLLAVSEERNGRVDLVDPASGSIQSSVRICGTAGYLVEVATLDRLYVLDTFCSEIAILRPRAGLEVGSIQLTERAGLLALGPRGTELLVPLPDSRRAALISVDRGDALLYLDVGSGPWRVIVP